jgi:protein-disulfide isomerase
MSAPPVRHQTVAFATGFTVDTREFPVVGPPTSPNLLVVMNDYTCPHCRELHHLLDRARERYGPASFATAVVTVPLNTQCNVLMRGTHPRHEYACDLAKLSVAVWRADATRFEEFDRWLYEPAQPPAPADARRKAESLIGAEALDRALADGFVPRTLQRNVALYATAGQGRLPKLIVPSGEDASREQESELMATLEQRFNLKPRP